MHTWDRTRDGQRSFRLDRMRGARLPTETFEPRDDFEPAAFRTRDARAVPTRSGGPRGEVERGARPLAADGSAVAELKVGSPEWLVGEILTYRGEAVVLEPADLRRSSRPRARALLSELGRRGSA